MGIRHHHHYRQQSHTSSTHYEKAVGGDAGRATVQLVDDLDSVYDYPKTFEVLNKDNVTVTSVTYEYIQSKAAEIVQGHWNKVPWNFTDWQKEQLRGLDEKGITCLIKTWLLETAQFPQGVSCNASWDKTFCWPPSPNGTIVSPTCSEVWESFNLPGIGPYESSRYASRVCSADATWLLPNYTACLFPVHRDVIFLDDLGASPLFADDFLYMIPALSAFLLGVALLVFWYFRRCIWCERITLHAQLMFAMLVRSFMLVIIIRPHKQESKNPQVDLICKAILSVDLYASVASINWFFLQGIATNGRWASNVFQSRKPYRTFVIIGWVIPMIMIVVFALLFQICRALKVWTPFADYDEIYVFVVPILLALGANLLFLCNIMRVVCGRDEDPYQVPERRIIRQAIKATFVLFPLLGINHLVFFYNPKGEWSKLFLVLHTVCGGSQGIFIALLYCFCTREVRSAIYMEWRRLREERWVHFRWPAFFISKETEICVQAPPIPPRAAPRPQSLNVGPRPAQQVRFCQIEILISSPTRYVCRIPETRLPTIHETDSYLSSPEEDEDSGSDDEEEYYESSSDDSLGRDHFDEIDLNRKVIRETML